MKSEVATFIHGGTMHDTRIAAGDAFVLTFKTGVRYNRNLYNKI